MVVIGVLIGILLPSISRVRESARRVVCGSNLRQVGLGLHMYAEDSNDLMPHSVFLPEPRYARSDSAALEQMDIVRTAFGTFAARPWGNWDGLGLLFAKDYLQASKVFYCPSHAGTHRFNDYEQAWSEDEGEIISNYQFRGTGPNGARRLYAISPSAAIVSDMLRSYEDINHNRGFNTLQAGLAVQWVEDTGDQISGILLRSADDDGSKTQQVQDMWTRLDGRPERPSLND